MYILKEREKNERRREISKKRRRERERERFKFLINNTQKQSHDDEQTMCITSESRGESHVPDLGEF